MWLLAIEFNVVCVYVCLLDTRNDLTDRVAIRDVDSFGPKEKCTNYTGYIEINYCVSFYLVKFS